MNDAEVLAYVKAAAVVMQLPLDEARASRVATHLARAAALSSQLEAMPLDVNEEPSEIYSPAPFPLLPHGHKAS